MIECSYPLCEVSSVTYSPSLPPSLHLSPPLSLPLSPPLSLPLSPPISLPLSPLSGSLYCPLKASEPFFLTMVLYAELISVGVFSYPLYLSTLIARGEAQSPIVPRLPFFMGEKDPPPDSPLPMDTEGEHLSLKVSLPLLPGLILRNRSPPKKKTIFKQEAISPGLPDRFGSQDDLLDPFDTIGGSLMSHDTTSLHTHIKASNTHVHIILSWNNMYI